MGFNPVRAAVGVAVRALGNIGGGDINIPSPPPPTQQELDLWEAQAESARSQTEISGRQADIAEQSFTQQQAFGAFLLANMGYQTDASGKIVPIEGSQAIEIQKLTQDRYLAALKGELPVDPALERNLGESETALRNELSRQLGPGYETSSAGIEALANFKKRAEELRYGVRTGELQTSAALDASQKTNLYNAIGYKGAAANTAVANLGAASQGYGAAAGTYGAAGQGFTNQRGMQFQSNLAQAQLEQENLNAIYGAVGTAAGVGIGAAAAFCCPEGALIETPIGLVPIEDLRVGDSVYSLENEERISVPILKIQKVEVVPGHKMRGLLFDDGSSTWLSFGHPLMDGRPVEALKWDDMYDGRKVIEVLTELYDMDHTFDILPGSDTGIYWIEGIPMGSTIKTEDELTVHGGNKLDLNRPN